MQNRVTCVAGERIFNGDRVCVHLSGQKGLVYRTYGRDRTYREIGEALEDAEKGGLVIVAADDGNGALKRGLSITEILREE